ncbi:UPF0481 protein [Glycine soja]|nr:UPF0481 protein [Glycine soja]
MAYKGDVVRINVKEMLEGARAPITAECCIYKVPFSIRRHNEEAYTPKVVSIGPFHHGNPRLQDMEKHKLFYSKAFLQRTQTTSDSFIGKIEEMEPEFRRCYSHTLEFSKEQLVKIIFVDCAFILELFCRYRDRVPKKDDMCASIPRLSYSIAYDLLLLENQVPFSVLESLFSLSFPSPGADFPSFLKLTFNFFQQLKRSVFYNINDFHKNNGIRHFTDLIRTFHLQYPLPSRIDGKIIEHLPSATELSEAGLRFKVLENESCLLKLDFSGRVLEIPQLVVDDGIETLFRNMLALEQCHYPFQSYITDYLHFLDFLVNTNRDVDILVREKVFLNWLGDTDSVATMINGLMKDITLPNISSQFLDLCTKLNAFHENPWRKLKSTLRRDYCRGPWQTAASTAAALSQRPADFLVNTNRDVDILVQERVFLNWLGDTDSVATMINGLVKDITVYNTGSQFLDVSEKLNAFHKNPWRKLKSALRRDYCRGPWQTAASIAAIILLILSFVQTVCSILQVIHQ